jgi:pyruvate/2-oxoglutarate dehydrogenase complex dihydrolipoamide dehydrogenase (E3) component
MAKSKTDVLIVGGGPGGMMTGMTATQYWPGKKITIIRPEEKALVPCGIPYIFGTLGGTDEDLFFGREQFEAAGIDLVIGTVESADREERVAVLDGGEKIGWERLVISTGAEPIVPPIPGSDLERVFTIHKEYGYVDPLFRETLPGIRRLVIIGGGFIGVEFADEIRKQGLEVHIIEALPRILLTAFDEETCARVEDHLRRSGVHIHDATKVEAIFPDATGERASGVRVQGGESIDADAVLIAIGARPNVNLARKMGLTLTRNGAIRVDSFQRTLDDPTVFAVGDCAQKQDFFTRREGTVLLASQALAEGRIAGMNMYATRLRRLNAGTVSIYAGQVGDLAFGVAGLTAAMAEREGFDVIVGEAKTTDRYPAKMPGKTDVYCRLIFSRECMQLLGGQIIGGRTTGELVNEIGLAIQTRCTAADMATLQFGCHPRLTAAVHPISAATGDALRRRFEEQSLPAVESDWGHRKKVS